MDRRQFIGAITGAFLAAPHVANGQQTEKLPRIGCFMFNRPEDAKRILTAFRQVLRERGWIEGQNIIIEYRFAEGDVGRLSFMATNRERAEALLVLTDAMFLGQRRRTAEFAAKNGLPAMYSQRDLVTSEGSSPTALVLVDMSRRGAVHVDKILRGAKPGELPVEQPTKFELVINLRTAKALGLTIPQALMLRADEILE